MRRPLFDRISLVIAGSATFADGGEPKAKVNEDWIIVWGATFNAVNLAMYRDYRHRPIVDYANDGTITDPGRFKSACDK